MDENQLSNEVIGAAIEVHRLLGPGLLEGVYDEALCHELQLRGFDILRQQRIPVAYKGVKLGADLRYDILVSGKLLIEVKAKETLSPTDKPQLLTYLRLLSLRLGLVINFHGMYLKNGIHRVSNGMPDPEPPTFGPPPPLSPSFPSSSSPSLFLLPLRVFASVFAPLR